MGEEHKLQVCVALLMAVCSIQFNREEIIHDGHTQRQRGLGRNATGRQGHGKARAQTLKS
jgi:hypothetical protein